MVPVTTTGSTLLPELGIPGATLLPTADSVILFVEAISFAIGGTHSRDVEPVPGTRVPYSVCVRATYCSTSVVRHPIPGTLPGTATNETRQGGNHSRNLIQDSLERGQESSTVLESAQYISCF